MDNPAEYYPQHPDELSEVGASAFSQPVEVIREQVAERFASATLGQIFTVGRNIVGFCTYVQLEGVGQEAGIWAIEGLATMRSHQRNGMGRQALHAFVEKTGAAAVTTVTRNPAVSRLFLKEFTTVLPTLAPGHPLRPLEVKEVRHVVEVYGRYLEADPAHLPFIHNRYPGGLSGKVTQGWRCRCRR